MTEEQPDRLDQIVQEEMNSAFADLRPQVAHKAARRYEQEQRSEAVRQQAAQQLAPALAALSALTANPKSNTRELAKALEECQKLHELTRE